MQRTSGVRKREDAGRKAQAMAGATMRNGTAGQHGAREAGRCWFPAHVKRRRTIAKVATVGLGATIWYPTGCEGVRGAMKGYLQRRGSRRGT